MLREGAAERDYFRRLFKTKAFKYILGPDFDSRPITRFAKPMALSIFESVLHPNFDPATRERCLKASGEVCCQVFLKHAGLNGGHRHQVVHAKPGGCFRRGQMADEEGQSALR